MKIKIYRSNINENFNIRNQHSIKFKDGIYLNHSTLKN